MVLCHGLGVGFMSYRPFINMLQVCVLLIDFQCFQGGNATIRRCNWSVLAEEDPSQADHDVSTLYVLDLPHISSRLATHFPDSRDVVQGIAGVLSRFEFRRT